MARTEAEYVTQQLGAQALQIARMAALIEKQQEEIAELKGKLPIETAALHEAGKPLERKRA